MAVIFKPSPIKRPTRELCVMACCFCKSKDFQAWLSSLAGAQINETGAKRFILNTCRITSRNELDTNPEAAKRFHDLVRTPFLAWKEAQG